MLRKIFDRPVQQQPIWTDEETAQPRSVVLLDANEAASNHVMLRKRPTEVRLEVVPGSEVTARFQTISSPDQHGTKAGIIWVKFLDATGNEVPSRGRISKGRQGNYIYIVPDALGWGEAKLFVPWDCTEVVLGFALWKGYPGSLSLNNEMTVTHSVLPPFPAKAGPELRRNRVALFTGSQASAGVALSKDPYSLHLSTLDSKHFRIEGKFVGTPAIGPRDVVVLLKFEDKDGVEVGSLTEVPRGPIGEYLYLVPASDGTYAFELHAPIDCVSVHVSIAAWHAGEGTLRILNAVDIVELAPESANKLRPGYGAPQTNPKALVFDRLHDSEASISVTSRAQWTRLPLSHVRGRTLTVKFSVLPRVEGLSKKSGLALVEFADSGGGRILPAELSKSEHGPYKYIDGRQANDLILTLAVPKDAAEVRVGTMLWDAAKNQLQISNGFSVEGGNVRSGDKAVAAQSSPGNQPGNFGKNDDDPKRAKNLKVALIADEFTYNCFKYEFSPIIIEPDNWRERFEAERPDLFLCESAWSGVDSVRRPWKGRVYTSSNFARENRSELLEILAWCKREGVPTVFWNKEDPTHFDDKVHNFIDTAVRFDHIFTTDLTCVPRYQEEYDHPSVHCLPFATQPRLFNPVETSTRTEGVSFAGSWYANHKERSAEMSTIFEQILEAGLDLRIFDRFWGSEDELHHFPVEYRHLTEPAIPHSKIADAYKSKTIGLNINTVTSSPTMFARRIFELMSCNTLVVSNYSPGVAAFFKDRILFAGEGHSDIIGLDAGSASAIRHAALHDVLANHTYERRFERILDAIAFDYVKTNRLLTLVCPVENEAELKQAIARQGEYADIADRLIVVLGAGFEKSDAAHYQAKYGRFGVVVLSHAWAKNENLDAASYISGDAFAVISPRSEVSAKTIYEASLHLSYADGPIAMGADAPYRYVTEHAIDNIVAPQAFLKKAVSNYGLTMSDNFYLV
ncbi:glycosyltransferase [Paenarthrobacter sp. NPDC089675]|uniref:CgeB family protein n=1 Tax=Paenarthrobacter sp. NPDC089675 TaxID=3364376 RepID=UPI003818F49A